MLAFSFWRKVVEIRLLKKERKTRKKLVENVSIHRECFNETASNFKE